MLQLSLDTLLLGSSVLQRTFTFAQRVLLLQSFLIPALAMRRFDCIAQMCEHPEGDPLAAGCGRQAVSSDDVAHMSAEEIFSFRQQYGNRMRQLLQAGAESAAHALHAELLKLVALWVRRP